MAEKLYVWYFDTTDIQTTRGETCLWIYSLVVKTVVMTLLLLGPAMACSLTEYSVEALSGAMLYDTAVGLRTTSWWEKYVQTFFSSCLSYIECTADQLDQLDQWIPGFYSPGWCHRQTRSWECIRWCQREAASRSACSSLSGCYWQPDPEGHPHLNKQESFKIISNWTTVVSCHHMTSLQPLIPLMNKK